MATDPKVPQSYDEIVRKTVPDPDSSKRPTERQEQLAREGFRAMDDGEQALHARVAQALQAASVRIDDITIEVDRDTVRLHGSTTNTAMIDQIEGVVAGVSGVANVENRLVVGP
ncbi:MAG: BON domain-containing protein [Deltaproteobacteria bacterium]|nr:BON domain-containing protein [Deltaproteobacteria bacterium]MDQ3299147.1 BON domain-containing protein [Myxococcota bacterium]